MRSGRVQLAMKSSVGRCIQNVWSSMVEMNTRLWDGSGHMFASEAKISKRTRAPRSPVVPVPPVPPQYYVLNKPQKREKIAAARGINTMMANVRADESPSILIDSTQIHRAFGA